MSKQIILGRGSKIHWPHQSGKITSSGMKLSDAMLEAEKKGYKPSQVVREQEGEPIKDCDQDSFPNGGGTSIETKYIFCVYPEIKKKVLKKEVKHKK